MTGIYSVGTKISKNDSAAHRVKFDKHIINIGRHVYWIKKDERMFLKSLKIESETRLIIITKITEKSDGGIHQNMHKSAEALIRIRMYACENCKQL